MFKSKYIKSLATTVVLASALFISTDVDAAKNFTDLDSDPSHAQAVKVMNSFDLFDYKTGTTLNGSAPVSRAEVSKILHNLFDGYIDPVRTYNGNFKDVNSKTSFQDSIIWAYESGIFDGDNNGNFNPSQTLTRAQMAKVLVNAFLLETDGTATFKDVPANHWAHEYINILGAEGYSVGSNGNFMPNNKVTLNQLSTFIWRINGEPAMAGTTQPTDNTVAEDVEFKTYEEVKQIAIDLFNSSEYEPERVTVYTKEKVDETFLDEYMRPYDLSEHLKGFTGHGRQIGIASRLVEGTGYYETTVRIKNDRDEADEALAKKKTADAVAYIKANYDTSTEYNIVKAVNEFLASQIVYNNTLPENHPYLELFFGTDCTGYSINAALLFNEFGIQSRLVTGTMDNGQEHMWNAIKLGGNWYYTDATVYDSDNGTNDEKFLIMSQPQLDEYVVSIETSFRATNTPYVK